MRGGCLALVAVVASGGVASAQEPRVQELPAQPEAPTRLVVEEIRSGFVVAPDLKLTSIDGGSGALAGLYGGFITDRRLLIGAGAYWLTGGPGGVDMAYGGGLVEWFANPGGRVDFSVRSLFGAGRARFASGVGNTAFDMFRVHADSLPVHADLFHGNAARLSHPGRSHGRERGRARHGDSPRWDDFPWASRTAFRYHEDFWVADPQVSVHLNVTDWLRIGVEGATASSAAPGRTATDCGGSRPASVSSWVRRRSLRRRSFAPAKTPNQAGGIVSAAGRGPDRVNECGRYRRLRR